MSENIEDKFWRFHHDNPEVFISIRRFAKQLKDAGFDSYGIGAVFERMRWEFQVERREDFRLNNSYRSRYARLLEGLYPEFRGFFTKRSLKTPSDLTEGH